MLCLVGCGAGPGSFLRAVVCECFGLSGVWQALGWGGMGPWACVVSCTSDDAWGFLLLGSWRCASLHHLEFVNFAVWALFSGPFLLCPGDEIVVLHGLVCSAQQGLLGFLSFCADGSPLPSSAWWDYGVPVLLICTPSGIT